MFELTHLRRSALAFVSVAVFALVAPARAAEPIRVACVGPQHVHSHQLDYPQEYPALLQKRLGTEKYKVENFGDCCATVLQGYPRQRETHPYLEGGESYPQVGGRNFKDSIKFMPNVVVIGPWGKHDTEIAAKLYNNSLDSAKLEKDYEQLIRTYAELPTKPRIFLMTVIPIPFGQPTGVATSVMQPSFLKVASALKLPVLDVYNQFLNKRPLFKDATHVSNDAGLKIIVDLVYDAITRDEASDGGVPTVEPVADAAAEVAGTGGTEGTGGRPTTGMGGASGSDTGGAAAASTGGAPATGTGGAPATGTGGTSALGGRPGSSPPDPAPSRAGCAAGGTPAPSAGLVLLGLCLLACRRRRRW